MNKTIFSVSFFNILSAGLAFLINIFLARSFPIEVYGRINLLLTFTLILNTVLDFGFSNTNVIFYNKFIGKHTKDSILITQIAAYRSVLIWLLVLATLVILGLSHWFNLSPVEALFLFSQGVLIAFFRYLLSFQQALGNWNKFNLLNTSINVFKLISLGIAFTIPLWDQSPIDKTLEYNQILNLFSAACALCLVLAIANTSWLFPFFQRRVHKEEFKKELNKIWHPLIGINLVIILAMRVDTIIIQKFLGEEQLGLFSAASSLALVFPLITNSIIQVLLKETAAKDESYLFKLIYLQKRYLPFVLVALLLIELASHYIIPIVFGAQYDEAVLYFQILVIAHLGGLFFTPIESFFYSKNTSLILLLKCIQLFIIVVVSLLTVRVFGLLSIVCSILLSRVFGWVFLMQKAYNLKQKGNDV